MSKTDGELRPKQAYTIRHTAILAYKHGDITKLELEALLDKLIAAERSQLLEAVEAELVDEPESITKHDVIDYQAVDYKARDRNKVRAELRAAIRRLQGEGE